MLHAHLTAPLLTLAGALGFVAATLAAESVPRYSAKDFYATVSINGASFSGDETRLLITTDESGIFNAYSQPVAGGKPAPMTKSTADATFGVSYFPQDDRILYTADQGGNELNHLYVRETDGTVKDLTPGEKVKASFFGWSGDFGSFFVQTNERDPQFFDVYRYAADGYGRELIFTNSDGYLVGDISRDGQFLAVAKERTNADNDLFVVDLLAEGTPAKLITPHKGDVEHSVETFTPDGRTLYFTSNEGSEFNRAWTYDMATGKKAPAIAEEWDIMYVGFSWDGRYRYHAINDDARTVIKILDTQTGKPLALPTMPAADITGVSFARSGKTMAYYVNGDTSPSNLYVMDVASGRSRKLTNSMSPKIDERYLVNSQVVRYPSFDSVEVPAILYKPIGASAANPAPAMLWIHGGPGGQTRTGYSPVIQFLVNHGYAVLAVNNRGSSGYGKTFFHMDDRNHGEGDLMDCVYGKRYLQSLDWIDPDRIGIMGGSYGGYMTVAAVAYHPDEFACAIDIFGVTNWLRTLESIPPWWAAFRDSLYAEMGDPATDRERLHKISPLFHAKNIVRPLMVVQGKNDPRVLQVESDEIVAAVKANGVPCEYVVFDDEGHGFANKANRITAAERYLTFLETYMPARK